MINNNKQFYPQYTQISMKFSQSQRELHRKDYNPPANVYSDTINTIARNQQEHLLVRKTLFNHHRTTFGGSSRFQSLNGNEPGPGTYSLGTAGQPLQPVPTNKFLKGRFYPPSQFPSIPHHRPAQQEDEQAVAQPAIHNADTGLDCSIPNKPHCYSFSTTQRACSYATKQTQLPKQEEVEEEYVTSAPKQGSRQTQTVIVRQQKIRQANDRRLQAIQILSPDFVPSLELIELMKRRAEKRNPGPGQYIGNEHSPGNQNCYPFQQIAGRSFSSVRRFPSESGNQPGPGEYQITQTCPKNASHSLKHSFGHSERTVFDDKKQGNFRFYISINCEQPENRGRSNSQGFQGIHKSSLATENMGGQIQPAGTQKRWRSGSSSFGSTVRFSAQQQLHNQSASQLRNSQQKINKMIRKRLLLHNRKRKEQKDEGLLGISTMASIID